MSLRLRRDSFSTFIAEQAGELSQTPKADPDGMCLLSGQILRRNVKEYLNRERIPTSPLAHFTTIEELASDLLAPTSEPSGMLQKSVRDRLIEEILLAADPNTTTRDLEDIDHSGELRPDEKDAIEQIAVQLPYEEDEARETLRDELDDYLRWTDATRDTSTAMAAIGSIENRFVQKRSLRSMDAFQGLVRLIEGRINALPLENHQSRSHLVTAARNMVDTQWPKQFDHVNWVAVAGIMVFDSPTLRFLEAIAEDSAAPTVHVFVNAGSFEYTANRIRELETGIVDTAPTAEVDQLDSPIAQILFDATQGHATTAPDAEFIEAPTDQRAVERVANDIKELLQAGAEPNDILVVAPDAGSYQGLMENAFETLGVPLFVETRHPVSDIPAYRCFRTLIEVIQAVATDERIPYGTLVDPLRLGYCEPGAHGSQWPIQGREFTKIEQELHRKQRFYNQQHDRYEDQGLHLNTWRSVIDEIPAFTADWDAVATYFDTLEDLAAAPPTDGAAVQDTFSSYLGTYVHQTIDHRRELYEAPAIDTTRTAITETHATSLAERVRARLDAVGTHYDRVQELFEVQPSWSELGQAFSTVLGGDSFGERHLDDQAVPLVDAGNAFFRDTSYLFVLGMNAEEFPGNAGAPTFLHSDLRQTVYDAANEGYNPYPHLDSRSTAYEEALDFYQATLQAARSDAAITLVHTYQDNQGNDVAWSSFVDLFDVEGEGESVSPLVDRVRAGEWLPQPRKTSGETRTRESWDDVLNRTSPRERLRLLLYLSNRDRPDRDPAISADELKRIASTIDPSVIRNDIEPRMERYRTPPTAVTIDSTEPAFDKVDFETVAGTPLRTHELDLNGQCGLKYYYYQLLYNFEGPNPERDDIPTYYSQAPHYRLGELPQIIRENYADPRYVEKWRSIVMELLPNRQSTTSGLAQFDTEDELRTWFLKQDDFEEYDLNTIFQNLLAERQLVEHELESDVSRAWKWRPGGDVEIGGHSLRVPSYRLDTVSDGGSDYVVPIFFTRFSNRASSALKTCRSAVWEANETTHTICLECDNGDSCGFNSKYVIDHRMLAGYEYETQMHDSKVVGIGLQEQYAGPDGGERVVAIRQGVVSKFHPFDGTELFESLSGRGYSQAWDDKAVTWRQNFVTQADQLDPATPVELTANMELVNQDECLNCVYRDLCAVPKQGGEH